MNIWSENSVSVYKVYIQHILDLFGKPYFYTQIFYVCTD